MKMFKEDIDISDIVLSGDKQKKKGSMDLEDEDLSELSFESNDI